MSDRIEKTDVDDISGQPLDEYKDFRTAYKTSKYKIKLVLSQKEVYFFYLSQDEKDEFRKCLSYIVIFFNKMKEIDSRLKKNSFIDTAIDLLSQFVPTSGTSEQVEMMCKYVVGFIVKKHNEEELESQKKIEYDVPTEAIEYFETSLQNDIERLYGNLGSKKPCGKDELNSFFTWDSRTNDVELIELD